MKYPLELRYVYYVLISCKLFDFPEECFAPYDGLDDYVLFFYTIKIISK